MDGGPEMTEAKEKRPRGRPPVAAGEKKVRNITFRSRDDMHERLSDAAATKGRSLSEEIEARLAQSFDVEERMAAFRETWEKRIEDLRQISEQQRKQAEQSREKAEQSHEKADQLRAEAGAFAEHAKHEIEKVTSKLEEIERKAEKNVASATMVDILLGDDKSKSALLREVALNIARMSSDQFRDAADQFREAASRHELVQRELSRLKKGGAGQ